MDVNIPTIAKTLNIMVIKLNGFTVYKSKSDTDKKMGERPLESGTIVVTTEV